MTRISKYSLDENLKAEMFRQFWLSLSILHDAHTVSSFFSDLLSETEEIMLAKRFTVAMLLMRGKKPVDILNTIHVSNSTISSVNAWLKNAKPRTKKIMELIVQDSRWQKMLDQVDSLAESVLPLPFGSNWSMVSSQRRKNKTIRTIQQKLR